MKFDEYVKYDGLGLKQLIESGEVPPSEVIQCARQAIDDLNPILNFLSATAEVDDEAKVGSQARCKPYQGVPMLLKEGAGMAGQPVSLGTRLAGKRLCTVDSVLVQRLKASGGIILGSTNSPELGNAATTESVANGPTRNPWNLDHSPGGSSGGSACAVAAGVVPIAQSSDGAGSIRIPAHCCGVFGLTPSRGRNPCGPGTNNGFYGYVRRHVITRSVRDSAAMLDQLHGPEPGGLHTVSPPEQSFLRALDATAPRQRIAFTTSSFSGHPVSEDCEEAVTKAARLCDELGHDVEEATPTFDWNEFLEAFCAFWSLEALMDIRWLEALTGSKAGPDTLEATTLALYQHALGLNADTIAKCWQRLHRLSMRTDEFFNRWDILISPVCLTTAPPLGWINAQADGMNMLEWFDLNLAQFAAFTPLANACGNPAMSVPLHTGRNGLPVGVHCMARFGNDAGLLQLAAQFENALPWAHRRPELPN
jgi:amidase